MKNNKIYLISLVILFTTTIHAQSIDQVIHSIALNNKQIKANQQFWEAKKLEYQTGLYPENPEMKYGYLPGNISAIGTKEIFGLAQSFYFPTAYFNKKKLSASQIKQAGFEAAAFRQNILLEAKLTAFDLVYLNKLSIKLRKRYHNANQLYADYKQKLKQGNTTILKLNKSKLLLVDFQNRLSLNEAKINQLNEKLTHLNGGLEINLTDTLYPVFISKNIEIIVQEMIGTYPAFLASQTQKEIATHYVKLEKSLTLPEIKVGYDSETVMKESYRGIQIGLSIPLWERKNTVRQAKANVQFAELQIESLHIYLISEIKQQYEKVMALKKSFEDYRQILDLLNSIELLKKSLDLGEISSIEYFWEISYFYHVYDNYLELEKEYYQSLVRLYKYEL